MSWAPVTDFEDAIFKSNNKPTFGHFEQENEYGLATLRPANRSIDVDDDDDDEDNDIELTELKADANTELQIKAYCRKLGNPNKNKPLRKWEGSEEIDSEVEITNILRLNGEESEPKNFRMNSKTTSKTAIAVDKVPVAGVKDLFLTKDHFKFPTPITYKKDLPKSVASSSETSEQHNDTATTVIEEQTYNNYNSNVFDYNDNLPSQSFHQRNEESSIGVAEEKFCTPRELYAIKARRNR